MQKERGQLQKSPQKTQFSRYFMKEIWPLFHERSQLIAETVQSNRWKFILSAEWVIVLKEIEKSECEEISMKIEQDIPNLPPVISLIEKCSFPSLKLLTLIQSKIANVQALGFLNMENIRRLDISNNLITNLKPLNKTKWPQLDSIVFFRNKVLHVDFSRTKMHTNNRDIISDSRISPCQVQDISYLTKIQPRSKQIFINTSTERIIQTKVQKRIEAKYR